MSKVIIEGVFPSTFVSICFMLRPIKQECAHQCWMQMFQSCFCQFSISSRWPFFRYLGGSSWGASMASPPWRRRTWTTLPGTLPWRRTLWRWFPLVLLIITVLGFGIRFAHYGGGQKFLILGCMYVLCNFSGTLAVNTIPHNQISTVDISTSVIICLPMSMLEVWERFWKRGSATIIKYNLIRLSIWGLV